MCSDYFDLQTRKDNVEILFDELRLGYEKVERSRDYYKGLMVAKVCHSVYEGQSYDKVNVFYLCEKIKHFLSDSLVQIHIPGFYHTKYGFRCGFSAFDELERKMKQCESVTQSTGIPPFKWQKIYYMKTAPQGAEAEPQSCGAAVAFKRDLLRRHPLWTELRYSARCHPHRDRGLLRLPGRFQPAPADSHAQRLWRPRILLRLPPAPARSG